MSPRRAAVLIALLAAGPCLLGSGCERDPNTGLHGAVLIVLDTLRADGLSAYGNPRPTSPRIDAFSRRSVVFERVVSSGTWTLPGTAGLLSGRTPTSQVFDGRLRSSLVEALRDAGYETAAFTEGGYVSSYFGIDRGFELFAEQEGPVKLRVGRLNLNQAGDGIEETFDAAKAWLRDHIETPFFLMVHTYEVHTPYQRIEYAANMERGDLPKRFSTTDADRYATGVIDMSPGERAYLRALYDGGVALADRHVGRLLDALQELGLADRTLVVLASDHGEDLGERMPYRPGNHGHSLYDEMLLVPLIVHDPRAGAPAGRIQAQVRNLDVMPTILELLDVKRPEGLDGRSLTPLMRGEERADRPAFLQIRRSGVREMISDGSHKLIRNAFPLVPSVELYDLKADPTESHNLAGEVPDQSTRLEETLAALRAPLIAEGPPSFEPGGELPSDVRQRLEALGYAH